MKPEFESFFKALDASPDAVFVTDRWNRIVFWNNSVRLLLGFSEEEAIGADCDKLLAGSDASGNRYCCGNCPVMNIANRGEIVRSFPLTLRASDEREVVTSVNLLQLRSGEGDEYLLAHVLRSSAPVEHRPMPEDDAAPRPRLVVARESADVRARKLTTREVEVLAMLAAGRSTPDIADRLHIAPLTARSHIQNILEKLEVHSKAEAVAFAFQKSLI